MVATRFPIEAGHVLVFARAVGYTEDAVDPREPTAIPATFAMAASQFDPEYPLRPAKDGTWHGSGKGPGEAGDGNGPMHAEQHFIYHRPLRVGDVLSATVSFGDSWEKSGRSGRLLFSDQTTEFRDEAGELVLTMRSVGVRQQALQ
jgi:hypothetical protein